MMGLAADKSLPSACAKSETELIDIPGIGRILSLAGGAVFRTTLDAVSTLDD
jgi:hypothetical protein